MKVAALTRALAGETENGDGYLLALGSVRRPARVVCSDPSQTEAGTMLRLDANEGGANVLLLVVDGIGHGPEAALVARAIIGTAEKHHALALDRLLRACHEAAFNTRGAALGVARISPDEEQLQFLGVGNVAIQICAHQPRKSSPKSSGIFSLTPAELGLTCRELASNSGIVGYRIPNNLRAYSCEYHPGDVVTMYSDGITRKFDARTEVASGEDDAVALAEAVFERHATQTDDATVVVLQ